MATQIQLKKERKVLALKVKRPRAVACAVVICLGGLFGIFPVNAQVELPTEEGIELGNRFLLKPSIELSGGYDNRVLRVGEGGADGDFYAEVAAATELVNHPARYNFWLKGEYGYRAYVNYSGLNNDFYTAAVALGTSDSPLLWNIYTDYAKLLTYNTTYNPDSGQLPGSILSQESKRFVARGAISYESERFNKTALIPGYTFDNYHQKSLGGYETDEGIIHGMYLKLRHKYSVKTHIYTSLMYTFQINQDEDGRIATALAGASYKMTAKTSWNAELGYAFADYELSGTDQGFVTKLQGNWQTTQKVSTYIFGGNNFQPGYGGGAARNVYRLGYGINWQAKQKLGFSGSVLHDYQEEIGSNKTTDAAYGSIRNFINFQANYSPVERFLVVAGIGYNQDHIDPNQMIFTLRTVYLFY